MKIVLEDCKKMNEAVSIVSLQHVYSESDLTIHADRWRLASSFHRLDKCLFENLEHRTVTGLSLNLKDRSVLVTDCDR